MLKYEIGQEQVASYCDYSSEPSDYVKYWDNLD
jgi:hypothetical protein